MPPTHTAAPPRKAVALDPDLTLRQAQRAARGDGEEDQGAEQLTASRPDTGDRDGPTSQRLDKWLWFIRLAKSRTLAATLVASGKIRVNKLRVDKPSHSLKVNVITAAVGRDIPASSRLRHWATGADQHRRPARCIEDLTPAADATKSHARAGAAGQGERAAGSGRPTKRDRRALQRLKGEPSS